LSTRDAVRELLAGQVAYVVGGAIRDEALGRPVRDLDVVVAEPEREARRLAGTLRKPVFPLSDRHGAWRVVVGDETVDFTPLRGTIEDDLASRDFTINAIAEPVEGGDRIDPHAGARDLASRTLRHVSPAVFRDDPLRLLRAVRLEDELGFRLDGQTEHLIRRDAELVARPAGERILQELERLSASGFFRLEQLDLLVHLGGELDQRLEGVDSAEYRLVAVFGERLKRFPVSNELRRYASALLRAERPADDSPRSIHRFRRSTEPWALDALAFVGAEELRPALERARAQDPPEPLVRGTDLGLPPGPLIGRLLEEIEEERAAGEITTREEALAYARRRAGAVRADG
jgi:tRNA nucleotidyltransferase/poly(A) polymerase